MTTEARLRGKRVGVIGATGSVDFMTDVPQAVRDAFASRLAQLEDAGVTVVRDLRLDGFRWTRNAILEHYNSQIKSLLGRRPFPRTPHQLYTAARISAVIFKICG